MRHVQEVSKVLTPSHAVLLVLLVLLVDGVGPSYYEIMLSCCFLYESLNLNNQGELSLF